MSDVIVFPDAAALVCSHIKDTMGEATDTKVPNPRPVRFVLARRLGGPKRNLVTDDATIGIECWDATTEDAHDLAQEVRARINALVGETVDGVTVRRVIEVGGPADLPDPQSTNPRFVFTVAIALRGEAITGS